MTEPLKSDDPIANAALDKLREVFKALKEIAGDIKDIGDKASEAPAMFAEAERAKVKMDEMDRQLHMARQEAGDAEHTVMDWTDAIEDFRRGILDRDELFRRTIGYV